MKILTGTLVLALASSAFAQAPATDIRVTVEQPMTAIDTPDSAKQLALVDARRKTQQEAVGRLKDLAEVKALQLKPDQLDAYAAAILNIQEQSARTSGPASAPVYQVDVLLRLDTGETIRDLGRIRKDQEASIALVELWKQMEMLHRQLPDQKTAQERQLTVTTLRVKHLAAQVTAALVRFEERPVGGRAPSAEGRERANALAEAAMAMWSDSPDAHHAMGDVRLTARDLEAAEAAYRKALAGHADSSSGHFKLANALLLQQKYPEAGAELREAIRLDPASVRAHTDLGWVLRAQQRVTDAVAAYKDALRLDPDFIDAHNGLAVTLAGQGQVADAVAEFREIVRIDPDSAIGYYNLAFALAELDKDEESAVALREVVRINPNHYNARYNLGELFRLEGKFDDSAKQFREYVRLAPDTPQNQRNLERAKDFIKKFENP